MNAVAAASEDNDPKKIKLIVKNDDLLALNIRLVARNFFFYGTCAGVILGLLLSLVITYFTGGR